MFVLQTRLLLRRGHASVIRYKTSLYDQQRTRFDGTVLEKREESASGKKGMVVMMTTKAYDSVSKDRYTIE